MHDYSTNKNGSNNLKKDTVFILEHLVNDAAQCIMQQF